MRRAIALLLFLFALPSGARASTDPRLKKAIPAPPGTTTIVGEVRDFTRDASGGITGFVLDNGIEVKLPPSSGPLASQVVGPRRKVRVDGKVERSGDSYRIDASSVNDLASGKTVFLSRPQSAPTW